jgi:hypothetical protein
MADGSVVEYDLANKAKFYAKDGTMTSKDKETAEELAKKISGSSNTTGAKLSVEYATQSVFKFTFKNDEITKIKELQGAYKNTYLSSNSKKYDADSMSYGSAEFDEDTVVFAIEHAYTSKTAEVADDNVATGAVSEFIADEDEKLIFAGLDVDEDGIWKVVVGFELKASVPEDSDAVIIASTKTVTYDDDDAVQITGIQAGKEVSYIIYDEDGFDPNTHDLQPEELEKGDVILIAAANAEGVVSDYKVLFAKELRNKEDVVTRQQILATGDKDDDIYYAVGTLDNAATKKASGKFFIDANVSYDGAVWAEYQDGITLKASANYTLVDYSESTKNPEILKKSANGVFSTSDKYETVVFVRVYDDVLREVVAYRFLAE